MGRRQQREEHQVQPLAALYVRVSTGGQEAEGTSLASQEEQCRRHAVAHGYRVDEAHIYREVHSGAELWERPRLGALRDAVRRGEVRTIVAHSLDRLSREQAHLYILDDECERAGVPLLFVMEEFEKTPVGKMIRSVKAFAAELEREKIRERTVRGKRQRAEAGQLHNHGVDLYGYRRDKGTRTRTVEEGEAAVVRHLFRWVGEERASLREVVRRLNEAGTPPPSAGKLTYDEEGRVPRWGRSQLHRILTNPAYKGEGFAWRYRSTKGRQSADRPAEEWIALSDGVTPAIVAPALWQAVQDRLATNTGEDTRNATRPFLLRGFIVCAVCGQRMRSDSESRARRVYRCSSRDKATGPCGGKRVPADEIEAWAWSELAAAIRDPARIARQWERERDEGDDPVLLADLATARRGLDKLTQGQERLVRRLRDADDDLWPILEREIAAVKAEKDGVRATIAAIEARLANHRATTDRLATLAAYCETVAGNLDGFGFDDKRLAFAAFRVRIEANGARKVGPWHLRGSEPDLGSVSQASSS